ncbi:uroplakin-3b-like [Erpetoichthys calabaricus]|uniref:uroplakin-3b-like n=1 Tax=Erpetoichthys calabaricus TaxID=27687 RepID=UPI0022343B2B|nr:uroplakin-3b-like [Erpetoichthys calabaricus]
MEPYVWTVLVLLLVVPISGQVIPKSLYVPQITSSGYVGRITATTFTLGSPVNFFNFAALGCTTGCQVWLVLAQSLAEQNTFDTQNTNPFSPSFPAPPIMTFVGMQTAFSSAPINLLQKVFRNGPFITGSKFSAKYFVVNNNKVVAETDWSPNINLITPQDPASIDTWFGKRSGGMVVITVILSVLTAILLLLFLLMLYFTCSSHFRGKENITPPVMNIKQYSTHYQTSILNNPPAVLSSLGTDTAHL